ncbi:hypothetical protein S7335_4441 [Synechococcus sp. PCC 7335]|nr:hypothetical protein S7335_4441 [Synechococcus sp. PCC 7335]
MKVPRIFARPTKLSSVFGLLILPLMDFAYGLVLPVVNVLDFN